MVLVAVILSGFPTAAAQAFRGCPVLDPVSFAGVPDRRARQIPLAREEIPGELLTSAEIRLPSGPDVISNRSLAST